MMMLNQRNKLFIYIIQVIRMKTLVKAVVVSMALSTAAVAGSYNGPSFGGGDTDVRQNQGQGQNQGQQQGQFQGQGQGQGQGQSSVNRNKNYNSNSSSSRSNSVGVGISSSYSEGSRAKSGSLSGAYSGGSESGATSNDSINIEDNSSVVYEAVDLRDNTPDAYAPSLTTSNGTCMGSSSVGGSGPGIGFSVGSTWTDSGCTHRYNAEMLYNLGYKEVAVKIMCREESVAESAPELCGKGDDEVVRHNKATTNNQVSNGFF